MKTTTKTVTQKTTRIELTEEDIIKAILDSLNMSDSSEIDFDISSSRTLNGCVVTEIETNTEEE